MVDPMLGTITFVLEYDLAQKITNLKHGGDKTGKGTGGEGHQGSHGIELRAVHIRAPRSEHVDDGSHHRAADKGSQSGDEGHCSHGSNL